MCKEKSLLVLSLLLFFIASLVSFDLDARPGDWDGPIIRWIGPKEGMCLKIDARHPSIGVAVEAEDPSGLKQGAVYMKKGHFTHVGDISTWDRMWGRTFTESGARPPAFSQHFMIRMLGRGQGEFTLMAEFHDKARPNIRRSFRHFFTDTSVPTISITSPTNNKLVCKDMNLVVRLHASDSGCGIKEVRLFLDVVAKKTMVGWDKSSPFQIVVDSNRFKKKSHILIAIAYDKAGNSRRTSIVIKPQRICKIMHKR